MDFLGGNISSVGSFNLNEKKYPKVTFDNFYFVNLPSKSLKASGDLSIVRGKNKKLVLTGKIFSEKAFYKLKGRLPEISDDFVGVSEPSIVTEESLSSMDLNVDLNISKLYLKGRGLDVRLSGKIKVTGTLSKPIFNGDVKVDDGYFKYKDLKLDIDKVDSYIHFDGAPFVPELNLKFSKNVNDLNFGFTLMGRVNALRAELFSEEPASNEEILSNLFFNRSFSSLGRSGIVDLVDLLNFLSNGGDGLSETKNRITGLFGLDSVNFRTLEDGSSVITFSKKIADRVDVSFDNSIGDSSSTGFSVQIRLSYNASVFFKKLVDERSFLGLRYKKSWD